MLYCESGLTAVVPLICTSEVWGQVPGFSFPEFPQSSQAHSGGLQTLVTVSPSVYRYGRKYSISQGLSRYGVGDPDFWHERSRWDRARRGCNEGPRRQIWWGLDRRACVGECWEVSFHSTGGEGAPPGVGKTGMGVRGANSSVQP